MRNVIGWWPLALPLLLPMQARAQSADAWRDSVVRLAAQVRSLRDSMVAGDSNTVELARRGNLVMSGSRDQRKAAVTALDQFTDATGRWFGTATPSSEGFRMEVGLTPARGASITEARRDQGSIKLTALPDTGHALRSFRNSLPANVAATLIDQYTQMMFDELPMRLQQWLGFPPSVHDTDHERSTIAMYLLVTGTGRGQRACVGGDVQACAVTLDTRRSTDTAVGGPFATTLRANLLRTAIDIGGPGAWGRFRDAGTAEVEPALVAAARIPLDSLITRWRTQLLALRPNTSPVTTSRVLLAIGWTIVALAGALGAARWG
jgi:hypothetical protein